MDKHSEHLKQFPGAAVAAAGPREPNRTATRDPPANGAPSEACSCAQGSRRQSVPCRDFCSLEPASLGHRYFGNYSSDNYTFVLPSRKLKGSKLTRICFFRATPERTVCLPTPSAGQTCPGADPNDLRNPEHPTEMAPLLFLPSSCVLTLNTEHATGSTRDGLSHPGVSAQRRTRLLSAEAAAENAL